MLTLSACGQQMGYNLDRTELNRATKTNKDIIGQVYFGEEHAKDRYNIDLRRDRQRRGYQIQAPIYQDDDGMAFNYVVSRNKMYRWFSGLQLRYEF